MAKSAERKIAKHAAAKQPASSSRICPTSEDAAAKKSADAPKKPRLASADSALKKKKPCDAAEVDAAVWGSQSAATALADPTNKSKPAAAAGAAPEAGKPKKRKADVTTDAPAAAAGKGGKKTKQAPETAEVPAPEPAAKKAKKAKKDPLAAAAASAPAGPAVTKPGLLNKEQVERAVTALCTHLARQAASTGKQSLVEAGPPIQLVLTTKQMPKQASGASKVHKPVRVPLPHAWRTLDQTEVCLVVKDPQRTFKDRAVEQGMDIKVIGVSKLKKKYVPFEAKRNLRKGYDLMLADERVLPMLPKLLGSEFFKTNKLPLPVNVTKKDLRAEVERCVGCAILRPTQGTCSSVTVATTEQLEPQVVENVMAAAQKLVSRIPGQWENVKALHLRSTDSVSLPVYCAR